MANFDPFEQGPENDKRDDIYRLNTSFSGDKDAIDSFKYRSFSCPYCRANISVTKNDIAKVIMCPDCGMKVAVPALDFSRETEYEHMYYNKEKLRKDEKFSPLRNPNRVGISLDSSEVYQVGLGEQTTGLKNNKDNYVYLQCSLCNTQLHVPVFMLGKIVVCPDCGSEIKVRRGQTSEEIEKPTISETETVQRDEQLSPMRNPNREGLKLDGDNIYGVREDLQRESQVATTETLLPVHCHVCGTLTHVPGALLGRRVICPDCGRATIVTNAFKEHEETINVKFQPRPQKIYGVGQEPISDVGKSREDIHVFENGSKAALLQGERKYDSLGISNSERDGKETQSEKNSRNNALERKAKDVKFDDEPKMVLRRKNGELVWAFPSPPKRNPMFNKTFRVARETETWTRTALNVFLMTAGILMVWLGLGLTTEMKENGTMFVVFFYGLCGPGIVVASAMLGLNFWSVFQAGGTGAQRVMEWRNEDPVEFILYGLWFSMIVVAACMPGLIVDNIISRFTVLPSEVSEAKISFLEFLRCVVCVLGSFVWFFPVFWLSTEQTDHRLFWPCSKVILTSFFSKSLAWTQLYIFSIIGLFLPGIFIAILCYRYLGFIFLIPLFVCCFSVFYALLLGRLGWLVEDEIRSLEYDD